MTMFDARRASGVSNPLVTQPETRHLARLIAKIRERYTIVLIEHDMQFLFDLADRISVIHWGQVIAEDTPAALRANKWVARSALGEVA